MVFYIIVMLILIGIVFYIELGVNDLVVFVMRYVGYGIVGVVIVVGVILMLLMVMILMMYLFVCLLFVVSKDGLLFKFMIEID